MPTPTPPGRSGGGLRVPPISVEAMRAIMRLRTHRAPDPQPETPRHAGATPVSRATGRERDRDWSPEPRIVQPPQGQQRPADSSTLPDAKRRRLSSRSSRGPSPPPLPGRPAGKGFRATRPQQLVVHEAMLATRHHAYQAFTAQYDWESGMISTCGGQYTEEQLRWYAHCRKHYGTKRRPIAYMQYPLARLLAREVTPAAAAPGRPATPSHKLPLMLSAIASVVV
eukprot:TRINITY_DN11850_c0_g1_i2.p1 TRINITY_DN11850_c0_g1~~TRINITY_DN11850_c0_g1_i2.p1  ORF type:complete len:263 (+),score=25.54 TRINITY_DN11850_c0_g1_i2:116-790(+)